MIESVRIVGRIEHARGVAVPVVGYLVVVVDMDPGKVFRRIFPIRAGIHAAILLPVVFNTRSEPARNVDVDEVSEEDHELRFEILDRAREML